MVRKIGQERTDQRNAAVESHKRLPLMAKDVVANPKRSCPQVAMVSVDGGRLQIRSEPSEPKQDSHWKESKVAVLETYQSDVHQADPDADVPRCFLDLKRTKEMVRGLGHALPVGLEFGGEEQTGEQDETAEKLCAIAASTPQRDGHHRQGREDHDQGRVLRRGSGRRARRWVCRRPPGRRRPAMSKVNSHWSVTAQAAASDATASQRWGRFKLRNARPPSSCQNGIRLNKLIKSAELGQGSPDRLVSESVDRGADQGRPRAPDRTGQADPRVLFRVDKRLLQTDQRPQARHEQRCTGVDTVSHQSNHMTHFMNVDRQYQPQREPAAEDRPVDSHHGEHREERAGLGQPQQEDLPLGQEHDGQELELPHGQRQGGDDTRHGAAGPAARNR